MFKKFRPKCQNIGRNDLDFDRNVRELEQNVWEYDQNVRGLDQNAQDFEQKFRPKKFEISKKCWKF